MTILGHDPIAIAAIRSGTAHRCRDINCDLVNSTSTFHCPECHRSFGSDRLAQDHILRGDQRIEILHADPPNSHLEINRWGTWVFKSFGSLSKQ